MAGQATQQLWMDYRFLTKEMLKFLHKQDMDLFYELIEQRERLQEIIKQTADDGFKNAPEGRQLLKEIQQESQLITQNLQYKINVSKRRQQVSGAYDGEISAAPVGHMNWQS